MVLAGFTVPGVGWSDPSVPTGYQSKLKKSMQQILRLLHLNLFEKRDLMALLRDDPPLDRKTAIIQMALL